MAITVTEDLIGDSNLVQDEGGLQDTRVFHIAGLTGGPGVRIQAMFAPKVPQYGDQHPYYKFLFVGRVQIRPFLVSQTECKAYVTYRPPDSTNLFTPFVQFRGTTTNIETSLDADGKLIKVKYKAPGSSVDSDPQIARVPASEAEGTLVITRLEGSVPSRSLKLLNYVNNSPFQGQPANSWWLRSVDFEPFLVRPGWKVAYTLAYRDKTWSEFAIFYDKFSGYPPSNITVDTNPNVSSGNGWVRAKIRGQANLASLALPKVFG